MKDEGGRIKLELLSSFILPPSSLLPNVREHPHSPPQARPIVAVMPSILRRIRNPFRLAGLLDRWAAPRLPSAASRPRPRFTITGPPPLADLLGRPAVNLDTPELQRFLAGKRVLVTGAGGSIGSEICRQAMKFCPSRVLLLERSENNLFEIDRELRDTWVGADVRPFLADVCDARRVGRIFRDERPHVVFHCAAHKHVPLMEANPAEAIRNNVFGTRTLADAANCWGVAAFVLVSTDKAVNPTSVMGATKRFAELYVQLLNSRQKAVCSRQGGGDSPPLPTAYCLPPTAPATRFLAVRFGNVLG